MKAHLRLDDDTEQQMQADEAKRQEELKNEALREKEEFELKKQE